MSWPEESKAIAEMVQGPEFHSLSLEKQLQLRQQVVEKKIQTVKQFKVMLDVIARRGLIWSRIS